VSIYLLEIPNKFAEGTGPARGHGQKTDAG
jgi:hypothetical protein